METSSQSLTHTLNVLVNTHGFQQTYTALMGIAAAKLVDYSNELSFINSLLVPCEPMAHITTPTEQPVQVAPKEGERKTIEIKEEAAQEPEEKPVRRIKVIKKGGRMIKVKEAEAAAEPAPVENTFEAAPAQPDAAPPKRTAKEMKKWQREQESARRKYMKANNISLASVLIPEAIQAHLSEGKTYAWIAREVTGQKEEEVSKWCKEKGLKKKVAV